MNRFEKRLVNLESANEEGAKRYAIVPPNFTGKLPPRVIGICTGVPRRDDRPDKFTMMRTP